MEAWGAARVVAAFLLSGSVYLLLAIHAAIALRWFGAKVRLRDIFSVSFVAYAFGNTIGLNLLIAIAVRVRGYARYGVDLPLVAATSLSCSVAFWMGLALLAGASLLGTHPGMGAGLVLAPGAFISSCALWRRPINRFGRSWFLPPPALAGLQVLVGALVNLALAGLISVLLQAVPYLDFAAAYAASFALGLVSGVPGGLGVFEGAMLTLLPSVDRVELAAAFIGYRLIYFLIPLLLAIVVMLVRERPWRRRQP